jgi:hypothetical protein
VGQTLLAFQSFAAMGPLIGKKHWFACVKQIWRGLRDSSKRALESDGPAERALDEILRVHEEVLATH